MIRFALFLAMLAPSIATALVCKENDTTCWKIRADCAMCWELKPNLGCNSTPDNSPACIYCLSYPESGSTVPCASSTCPFNGATLMNGDTVEAYQASSVTAPATCVKETRTCLNGSLTGSYTKPSCVVNAAMVGINCTFNGSTVIVGATVEAYEASFVTAPAVCRKETRLCRVDGTLSGSFTKPSCVVNPAMFPTTCTFNGITVPSGGSVTAWEDQTEEPPETCKSETRTCTGGVLSGSYQFASCTEGAAPAGATCTQPGRMEWHQGESKVEWCDGGHWRSHTFGTGDPCPATSKGKTSTLAGEPFYCNGTNWIKVKGPTAGACAGTKPGTFRYFPGSPKGYFAYCDGSTWYKMDPSGGGPP